MQLPDVAGSSSLPTPTPQGGAVPLEPVNWRQVGMAGQFVQGAGRELEEASHIVAATSDRQDQKVALDAANRLKAAQLDLEQNPTNGFTNARGNAVIGPQFIETYNDRWQAAQSQIAENLANENQRRIFQQHSEVMGLQFKSALLQHQAKQTIAFNATTREDTVNLGLNDIAAHPYDDSTYATNQLLMGRTVVEAGKDMGLTGDALANFVSVGTTKLQSKALLYRTSGMLLDNPMKAADFFHQHELEFDPQDRMHLATTLKTAVDAQTSRVNGEQAYKQAIGSPAAPALPANVGADLVKPFDAARINQIADQVKRASPYDALFQKYAQAYNISPTELKLRAVVESGLDASAVSSKGAIGLMQFTPDTAKAYGIDPSDPEQAIAGAARLMAQAGGTVGGDMAKVDRTYYGGAASAQGKNTDQYVENMRAARQCIFGAPAPVLTQASLEGAEGRVIDMAKAVAQQQRPGDLVYQDQVIAEARKNWATTLAGIRGQNEETVSNIMSLLASDNPPKALGDLPLTLQKAYAELPGSTQAGIQAHLVKGDPPRTSSTQQLYYTMLGQYSNNREQFAQADLSPLISQLPHADFDRLANLQVAARNKAERDADKQVNLLHALSIANDYALKPAKIPIPTKDTPANQRALYDQFTGRLAEQLDQFRASNNRVPNDKEIVGIARNLTTTVQVPGKWWGTADKRAFEIGPDQEATTSATLSDQDKTRLTSGFTTRYGRAPSDTELQALRVAELLHGNDVAYLRQLDAQIRANKRATQ